MDRWERRQSEAGRIGRGRRGREDEGEGAKRQVEREGGRRNGKEEEEGGEARERSNSQKLVAGAKADS